MIQKIKIYSALYLLFFIITVTACAKKSDSDTENKEEEELLNNSKNTYTNPLLDVGAEPWATLHNGYYYYMHGMHDKIVLWKTKDLTDLRSAPSKVVWIPQESENAYHLWGPEIHFIKGKWYIYFTADNGHTDNHQIYVIENDSPDPFEGEFNMLGRIPTDKENNWAIHASVFEHKDGWYMIWSGWQTRRIEIETQCIYIAKMDSPSKLSSERVLISKPEYEWERQWINPDGSKTAYPIFVNESPQLFRSKNEDKLLIYYSASGNWTPYYSVGLLEANVDSDLLDPKSWKKHQDAVFKQSKENKVFSTGNFTFIPSPDKKEMYFIYQARNNVDSPDSPESRSPRMQKIEWDEKGIPIFGVPLSTETKLIKPSNKK